MFKLRPAKKYISYSIVFGRKIEIKRKKSIFKIDFNTWLAVHKKKLEEKSFLTFEQIYTNFVNFMILILFVSFLFFLIIFFIFSRQFD